MCPSCNLVDLCSKTLSWWVTNDESLDMDQFWRLGFSPSNSRISNHHQIVRFCKSWQVGDEFCMIFVEIQDNRNPIGWNLCIFFASSWISCLVPPKMLALWCNLSAKHKFRSKEPFSKMVISRGTLVPICVPWNVWNSWIPRSLAPAVRFEKPHKPQGTRGQKVRKSTNQGSRLGKGCKGTNSPWNICESDVMW